MYLARRELDKIVRVYPLRESGPAIAWIFYPRTAPTGHGGPRTTISDGGLAATGPTRAAALSLLEDYWNYAVDELAQAAERANAQ